MQKNYEEIQENFWEWMEETAKNFKEYASFRKKINVFQKKMGFENMDCEISEINSIEIQNTILSNDFIKILEKIKKAFPEKKDLVEETFVLYEQLKKYEKYMEKVKIERESKRTRISYQLQKTYYKKMESMNKSKLIESMLDEAVFQREKNTLTELLLKPSFSNELADEDMVIFLNSLRSRLAGWEKICRKWELIIDSELLKLEYELEDEIKKIDPLEAIWNYQNEKEK